MLAYTVIATLPDAVTTQNYIRWLLDGHIDQVLTGGATSAAVVHIQEPFEQVESRYTFASRESFDAYVRDIAPALRADGVGRFPAARFERRLGSVVG